MSLEKKNSILNYSGFTIVELMVAVGVIGILAQVSMTKFHQYKVKARTSEAKVGLSSIYVAMESFRTEFESYGTCLADMGYDPSSNQPNRYYAIGFPTSNAFYNGIARSNGAVCSDAGANQAYFSAGKSVNGVVAVTPLAGGLSNDNFVVSAYAHKELIVHTPITPVINVLNPFPSAYAVHFGSGETRVEGEDADMNMDIWSIDGTKRVRKGANSLYWATDALGAGGAGI